MSLHVCGRYENIYDRMASVHKDSRNKSPYWYCAYRLPNGKRTFRSTKLTDRKAAEEFCRRLEYASNESKAGRLIETRARQLISEIVEHATGEPLRNFTTEEWFREWLTGKKASKAVATFLKYANAVKGFLASLGPRAKLNVNQIPMHEALHDFLLELPSPDSDKEVLFPSLAGTST